MKGLDAWFYSLGSRSGLFLNQTIIKTSRRKLTNQNLSAGLALRQVVQCFEWRKKQKDLVILLSYNSISLIFPQNFPTTSHLSMQTASLSSVGIITHTFPTKNTRGKITKIQIRTTGYKIHSWTEYPSFKTTTYDIITSLSILSSWVVPFSSRITTLLNSAKDRN